jgi:hypothetical protein
MKTKNLFAALAVIASASAFAQQTEFVAPDAGFHSSKTRAEVRQELATAYAANDVAQRQHDGQDLPYAGGRPVTEQIAKQPVKPVQAAR